MTNYKNFLNFLTRDNIETTIRIVVPITGLLLSGYLTFKLLENLNPTMKDKKHARTEALKLLKSLDVMPSEPLSDHEVCIASMLIDPLSFDVDWTKIGGHKEIIDDLLATVILPFTQTFATSSKLFCPPKGVLLHGPPGCGKTLIAKAMARSANARFINLQIKNLTNMWYGESQKLAEAVFTLAYKIQPAIIFIDEIDSFLNARSGMDNEPTRMMKTQFMALWDGVISEANKSQIMVIGTTNRPADLDAAILRRLPYKIYIPMPDCSMREEIYRIILKNEKTSLDDADYREIAERSDKLSGSDIHEVCRYSALSRFSCNLVESSSIQQAANFTISLQDILEAIDKFVKSQRTF